MMRTRWQMIAIMFSLKSSFCVCLFSTLYGTPLKLVDKFSYLGSSVSSTEKDTDTRLMKAWTAIDRLSIIWKSDLTDKMKRSFFQAAVVSILLYGCTTWTLTERLKKKLDGNYTRMLRAIFIKSWKQHPIRHQLYGHLPPITKTIKVRRTRHAGHCLRCKDELISVVLLWTPTYGQAKAGRPVRTYIQQLCEDTGCSPEDRPEAMNDREKWRKKVRDICASGSIWWWWICFQGPWLLNLLLKEFFSLNFAMSVVRSGENCSTFCIKKISLLFATDWRIPFFLGVGWDHFFPLLLSSVGMTHILWFCQFFFRCVSRLGALFLYRLDLLRCLWITVSNLVSWEQRFFSALYCFYN